MQDVARFSTMLRHAGDLLVNGIQLGNIWIGVQPALGVEGDPMRLLFERDLTPCATGVSACKAFASPASHGPCYRAAGHILQRGCFVCRHPQYAAFYKWLEQDFGADAVLHFGMHGTVEWVGVLQLSP
jgi:magnesium chelatase subunit H